MRRENYRPVSIKEIEKELQKALPRMALSSWQSKRTSLFRTCLLGPPLTTESVKIWIISYVFTLVILHNTSIV